MDDPAKFYRELLSLASHELRSPLAAIKGRLALIAGGTYGAVDPRAKEALAKAQYSADELIDLIDHFLNFHQIEAGKLEYHFEKTDLAKLVRAIAAEAAPLAESRGLGFEIAVPDREIWVDADARKLKSAVHNLVDNAFKYTRTGSVRVAVVTERSGGKESAVIAVADTGIGISASALPHLFGEFTRGERVKKETYGTGLGLYIAKKFVEAHDGVISAESAGEGKGSTFRVTVPLIR